MIKRINIILVLSIIAIGIATLTSYIHIALSQPSPTTRQASPGNVGQSPPPSVASSSGNVQQANANPAPAGNVTAPAVAAPPKRIIVGPSSVNASPVTSEIQASANATSILPNNGLFLGTPPGR